MPAPSSGPKPRWLYVVFLLFVVLYSVFRVALFAMTQTGAVKPDHPLDPTLNAAVVYSELAIGLAGLGALPGLVWPRPWGFWVTVGVSVYAIVFDAVSAAAVQLSAAGGVVPPVVILLGLLVFRSRFVAAGSTRAPARAAGT